MAEADGNLDQQAEAALEKVRLASFTSDPDQILPFGTSTVSWQVTVPDAGDVSISVKLDGVIVDPTGELAVSPPTTTTFHAARKQEDTRGSSEN